MSRPISDNEDSRGVEAISEHDSFDRLSRSGSEKPPVLVTSESPGGEFGSNRREQLLFREKLYSIRPSEERALADLGTFRVIREKDLVKGVYGGNGDVARADLRSLVKQRLIHSIQVPHLNEGPSRVLMLSGDGHQLLSSRAVGTQSYHWGTGKPSEIDHDSLLYRAYLHERHRIERMGGRVRRVSLDSELKRAHYSRLNRAGGHYRERQLQSSRELHLPIVDGHVAFPDFRVEYEDERGEVARADVEVATGNYRQKHIAVKSEAGFRVYASRSGGYEIQSGGPLRGNIFREQRVTLLL